MKNKKGFVLSILLFLFIFGVTIPLFMTNNIKAKAETITDLTGYTWTCTSISATSGYGRFYVNYNLNGNDYEYTELSIGYSPNMEGTRPTASANEVTINNAGMITLSVNDILEFLGGTNITNSSLISWLEANGTLTPPAGTTLSYKYWAANDIIYTQNDVRIADEDIQYKVLYNQFTDTYTNTTQTGLIFVGVQTSQTPSWSYIESVNGDGINILYHGTTNNIDNTMLLEFTIGDTMANDLYNFMTLQGHWFNDYDAYSLGINQGYENGITEGRALGQADGTQYTGLVTGIFNGLGDLLSVEVFPNITIALLIGLPLLLGAFIIIIKILRG